MHWTVDKVKGRQHLLKNLGQATAYAVELQSDAVRFDGPTEARNIQPGEAVTFTAFTAWGADTPELVVSWADEQDGERKQWRRPLP